MKKQLLFLIAFLNSWIIWGQINAPMFSTTIYVKDAIGQIDSVIIGHDSSATVDIESDFGEEELFTPFDSVFEVRTGESIAYIMPDGRSSREKLSKKIISFAEERIGSPHDCWSGGSLFIYIQAKYQPVTVYWNRKEFDQNPCVRGSLITDHWKDVLVFPFDWNRDTVYKCLAVTDSLTLYTSGPLLDTLDWRDVSIRKEVEGKGMQTIYGIRYMTEPFPGYTPCNEVVNTNESNNSEVAVTVFPNPVSDILNISGEEIENVRIFDLQGQKLLSKERILNNQIDVSSLISGIYFIVFEKSNSERSIRKFIKI